MFKNILRKKTTNSLDVNNIGLNRSLSLWNLVFFGIASIIGGGSFSTIGKASAYGGPAVIFLFFIVAIVCCLVAFSYAELASRFPHSGSAYSYLYIVFGEITAWLIGWTLIIEYTVGNIVVAISFSEYLVSVLHNIKIEALGINGLYIPDWLSSNYFDVVSNYKQVQTELLTKSIKDIGLNLQSDWHLYQKAPKIFGIPIIINLPAFLVTLFVSSFAYIGIKMTNNANHIMVIIKFAVIAIIVLVGLFYIKIDNWVPFAPKNFDNMLSGLSSIFFAYVGFDAISMVAEEAKNPRRDIPRALIISLILCALIYVLIAITITGIVPYNELNIANPLSYVFSKVGNSPVVIIVSIGILISMMNALMAFQVAQPRLWMNMGRDRLIPKAFALIHNKYKTPYISTILAAFAVALPASIASFDFAIDITSLGALLVFMMVCLSVIKVQLNNVKYNNKEGFKIPFINSKYIFIILLALSFVYILIFKQTDLTNFIYNKSIIKSPEQLLPSLNKIEINNLKNINNGNNFPQYLSSLNGKEYLLILEKANIDNNKIYISGLQAFVLRLPIWVFISAIFISLYFVLKYRISLIPLLGFLFCLYFALEIDFKTWLGFLLWTFIGIAIYFIYGYKKSQLKT